MRCMASTMCASVMSGGIMFSLFFAGINSSLARIRYMLRSRLDLGTILRGLVHFRA